MSAETASPIVPEQGQPPDLLQQDRTIQRRINRARFHVKLVELATAWTQLAAGVLVFLLGVTLIDHWAIGLTLGMRLTALILLLVASAAFCIWRLVPSLTRPVNPVYAAHAIEQAVPTLKNSLINFLLLRGCRDSLRPVIYAGVQRQAAEDLATVDVDSAVDRSELIHVGYLLAAVVVLFGLYKVTSPKDPFQSIARVIMPWKSIPRPSRVQIRQVSPGAAEVYRGATLEVTALVDGLKDDEAVRLCYSTEDRQAVDREIPLQRSESDPRFRGQLTTGEFGIQEPLVYHLQAGDARTEGYRVLLKEAPSISLQSVEYRYPTYTGWPNEKVTGQGDLKALEGTRVYLEALANQPIRSAHLELFTPEDLAANGDSPTPSKAVPIKSEGQRASGQMTLALQPDRRSPQYAAYRIRFLNRQRQRNVEPAQYRIDVTPDLPPLVEIISPRRRDVELPLNRSLPIEVRALDPDFSLRRVSLQAAVGSTKVVQQLLLDELRQGQFVQTYEFVPGRLGLSPGDVVLYWATAEDNRTVVGSQTSAPNRQRTADYRIRIVAADRPPDDSSSGEPQDAPQEDVPQPAGEPGDAEQPTSDDSEAGSSEQTGQDDSASDPGEEASSGEGGDDPGEPTGDTTSGEKTQPGEEGTEPGSEDTQPGSEDTQSGSEDTQSGSEDTQSGSENRENTGPGSEGSEPGGESTEPGGADGSPDRREGSSAAEPRQPGSDPSDGLTADPQEPVASDGSNDSDAFDRILDHRREQQPDPTADAEDASPAGDPKSSDSPGADDDASESSSPPAEVNGQAEQPATANDGAADQTPGSASGSPDGGTRQPSDSRPPSQAEGSGATARSDAERADGGPQSDHPPSVEPARNADAPSTDGSASGQDGTGQPQDRSTDSAPRSDEPQPDTDGVEQPQPGGAEEADGGPGRQAETSEQSQPPGQPQASEAASKAGPSGEGGSDGTGASPATTADGAPADSPSLPGGQSATGETTSDAPEGSEENADDPNLQFAQEATDLALEHLRDQQDNPQLLERLGWTPEQAAAFLRRWQQMRREAGQQGVGGQQARRRLDDQLRGLGLRPNAAALRRDVAASDGSRGLMEGGGRSAPPPEYRDQNRAFLRSFSRHEDP